MMSEQWANRVVGDGSSRVFRLVVGQPSWAARLLVIGAMLIVFAILAVIVIPVVVVGAVALLGGVAVARVRGWMRGLRAPNGTLDERRNVRVIVRE